MVLILNVFGCTLWIKIPKARCVAAPCWVCLPSQKHVLSEVAETGEISGFFWVAYDILKPGFVLQFLPPVCVPTKCLKAPFPDTAL